MTTVPSYFFPPYTPHFVSYMTYVSPPVCTVYVTHCQLYLPWWVAMNECGYVYIQKGMTAVHHAVRSGRLSALKVLLEDCQCQLDLKAEVSMCSSSAHNRCQKSIHNNAAQCANACIMYSIGIWKLLMCVGCALFFHCTVMVCELCT